MHPTETQILAAIGMFSLAAVVLLVGRLRRRHEKPRQFGPYTLGEKIGQGAMGEVYRAWHSMLHRWCAIKLLPGAVTEREQRRFENEVRLTAQLSHPNTVSIYDFGRADDGTFYYAMELLDGVTLQQLVDAEGPQPPSRVIHILEQLCAALREAHDAGLIHRDIKPDNIVLCRRGGLADVAKLLDFGLVAQVAASTNTDVVVGTPLYLSPEAITAPNSVSARSDLYALGAVAYFLLTGTPVFHGTSVVEVCSQHLYADPQPLPHVGADLERIVLDCLSKNPLDRPTSAAALAQRLARCNDALSSRALPQSRTDRDRRVDSGLVRRAPDARESLFCAAA